MTSVMQTWTHDIPMRQQGVLIIALRGPDGVRKEDAAKPLVRTIRGMVMNAGRTGMPIARNTVWQQDPFMTLQHIGDEALWTIVRRLFLDQWDSYNVHFLQHLLHAYAVLGIHHPEEDLRDRAWLFYEECCHKLHMNPETAKQFQHRLRDGIREGEE